MAAIAILTVACTTGVMFLLRFLVAICGKDGRGNHVVHVLRAWPEHDGHGGIEHGGIETDPDIAVDGVNQYMPHRRMAPAFAAKPLSRHDSGGTRGLNVVQRMNSPTQGRTNKAGKSIR